MDALSEAPWTQDMWHDPAKFKDLGVGDWYANSPTVGWGLFLADPSFIAAVLPTGQWLVYSRNSSEVRAYTRTPTRHPFIDPPEWENELKNLIGMAYDWARTSGVSYESYAQDTKTTRPGASSKPLAGVNQ